MRGGSSRCSPLISRDATVALPTARVKSGHCRTADYAAVTSVSVPARARRLFAMLVVSWLFLVAWPGRRRECPVGQQKQGARGESRAPCLAYVQAGCSSFAGSAAGASTCPSMLILGRRRSSHRGSHLVRLPVMSMTAGRSTQTMTPAMKIAEASPRGHDHPTRQCVGRVARVVSPGACRRAGLGVVLGVPDRHGSHTGVRRTAPARPTHSTTRSTGPPHNRQSSPGSAFCTCERPRSSWAAVTSTSSRSRTGRGRGPSPRQAMRDARPDRRLPRLRRLPCVGPSRRVASQL